MVQEEGLETRCLSAKPYMVQEVTWLMVQEVTWLMVQEVTLVEALLGRERQSER